jgi:hypothetical protein
VPKTFGKARKTVGKSFAERYTRRTPLGEGRLGKAIFAECFLSSTRETLLLSAKLTLGIEFLKNKNKKTPAAGMPATTTNGRAPFEGFGSMTCQTKKTLVGIFAECHQQESTRQIASLPSAKKTLGKPSSLPSVFLSTCQVFFLALGKELIYRV